MIWFLFYIMIGIFILIKDFPNMLKDEQIQGMLRHTSKRLLIILMVMGIVLLWLPDLCIDVYVKIQNRKLGRK